MITVGIDLGTTNSCVAYFNGHKPEVIELADGSRTMPSVVAFVDDETLVGAPALEQVRSNPLYTYQQVKRLIGKQFSEEEDLGYQVVQGMDGEVMLRGPEGDHSPVEMSAHILRSLKAAAEEKIGLDVDGAVITVPAYFGETERSATAQAGFAAGFKSVTLLNEPTAAALAYGLDLKKFTRVAVYDLGGGTFGVALMDIGTDLNKTIATSGNLMLGGMDFDRKLARAAGKDFEEDSGGEVLSKPEQMGRIVLEAERAKVAMSVRENYQMNVPFLALNSDNSPDSLQYDVLRPDFEELTRGLIDETLDICQRTLNRGGRTVDQVDVVLMVGGMTRLRSVRSAVDEFFGDNKGKSKINNKANPDIVIALGAALKAAEIDNRTDQLIHTDVTPHGFGFRVANGNMMQVVRVGHPFPMETSVVVRPESTDQEFITIEIMEGERPIASQNRLVQAVHVPLDVDIDEDGLFDLIYAVNVDGLLSVQMKGAQHSEPLMLYKGQADIEHGIEAD